MKYDPRLEPELRRARRYQFHNPSRDLVRRIRTDAAARNPRRTHDARADFVSLTRAHLGDKEVTHDAEAVT